MQKVKFDSELVQVLKNFNTINPSIYFKEGKVVTTVSPQQTLFARYDSNVKFESSFGIYKLDKLLNVLSFFDDPDVEIHESHLVIKSGKQKAKLNFADTKFIVYPKKDSANLPSIDIECVISKDDMTSIVKSASVMELPNISIEGKKDSIYLSAFDPKERMGDNYKVELEGKYDGNDFVAIFSLTNFKLIPADYNVEICAKGIAKFSNDKYTYWVPVEKDSKF